MNSVNNIGTRTKSRRRGWLLVASTAFYAFGPLGNAAEPRGPSDKRKPHRLPTVSHSSEVAKIWNGPSQSLDIATNAKAFAAEIQRCAVEFPADPASAHQGLTPPQAASQSIHAKDANSGPVRWLRSSSASANAEVSRRLIEQANREYQVGAWLSAETTAWEALRLAAEGIDLSDRESAKTQLGARVNHASESLQIARTAIREARDFGGVYGPMGAVAMKRMALSHSTDVLDHVSTDGMTGTDASDRYLDEARVALCGIATRSVEAAQSMDLLAAILMGQADARKLPSSTALCLRRAALQGQPNNASLASRLGRHLADVGLLEEARWALEHSLAMEHDPTTADALVAVLRHTGQNDRAARVLASIQNHAQASSLSQPRLPEITELTPTEFASISKPVMAGTASHVVPTASAPSSAPAMLAEHRPATPGTASRAANSSRRVPSVLDIKGPSAADSGAGSLSTGNEGEKKPNVFKRMVNSLKRVW